MSAKAYVLITDIPHLRRINAHIPRANCDVFSVQRKSQVIRIRFPADIIMAI